MRADSLFSTLVSIVLLVAGTYAILLVLLYLFQSRMLYLPDLPTRKIVATPERLGLTYEQVAVVTPDGFSLVGWYVPAVSAKGTVLFFHGNAGNISHRIDSLYLFNQLGYSSFIIDYRGYGQSGGKPGEEGTYTDSEAAWSYLTSERGLLPDDIVIFGRSIGAAIGARLAAKHAPRALIIESAFTSVPDIAAELYPLIPARLLARFHYDTREYLSRVRVPVLVVHSRDDEIIPYAHGRALFAGASAPKRFLELRGGHNDGFFISHDIYMQGLHEFLSTLADRRGG